MPRLRPILLSLVLWLLASLSAAAQGIFVDGVVDDGGAARAGIRAGDHLLRLAGREIAGVDDLDAALAGLKPGDTVAVSVVRDGTEHQLELVLGGHPSGDGLDTIGGTSLPNGCATGVTHATEPPRDTTRPRLARLRPRPDRTPCGPGRADPVAGELLRL